MKPDFEKFDARLRAAIGDEPLYTWAARVGIRKSTLNSALSRKAIPKAELLIQMANELDCSVDFLLGRCDESAGCTPALVNANHVALADAVNAIQSAYGNVEKLARQAALSPEEQQIMAAFRTAGPVRRQLFLDWARGENGNQHA